jgi:CD2 antigen cytoplasmic tail-binding protein 2
LEADDYSAGIEAEIDQSSSATKKHTMESDDEEDLETYNKKKYDVLKDEDIEGQEDQTEEFDGDTKITPFNMNEEMEDGYFDGRGMYIWNKRDEVKDSWLDSVDWVQIRKEPPLKPGQKPKESKGSDKDLVSSTDDTEDPADTISLYKDCLNYLLPGENFQKAIKRLGGGEAKQLSASERLKLKKFTKKAPAGQTAGSSTSTTTPEPASTSSQSAFNKLTELVNKIMFSSNNLNIYDETYESVVFKIQEAEKAAEEDIFQ